MCTGLEVAALVAATAGTAISVKQQSDMADFQAEQASANADTERQAGEIRAQQSRERARKVAASARASLAASGIDVGSPSADLINKDIIERGEKDAFTQTVDATDRATALRQQADISSLRGSQAQVAGALNIASSVISTGANSGAWGSQGVGESNAAN